MKMVQSMSRRLRKLIEVGIWKGPVALVMCGLLVGCPALPGSRAGLAGDVVDLPGGFDGERVVGVEMVESLSDVFRDRALRARMVEAQRSNPDLEAAAARLEEAGFNTRRAQAGLFPQLGVDGGVNRGQTNSAGFAQNFGPAITDRYSASLDVQWEVDVFGRVRAGIDSAYATREAAAAELAAASQSIAAQTAQAWFDLVAATQLQAVAQQQFESFKSTFQLVDRRFELGTSTLGDLQLARTDVENARGEINERKNRRDQAARGLAVLTGEYPDADARALEWPELRRGVAAGIPSTVLLRRPDIFAAYARIRAADADVQVAYADLFPSFRLTASGGQQSGTLKGLADTDFTVWSIAGNLVAPLIDGGRRRADLGAANARAKRALADYRGIVLQAFREVEDALGSEFYLRKQVAATRDALAAARKAEDTTLRNYEAGLVEILTVLDATRRRFAAQERLINLQNLRYQNRVSLALALGKAY